MRLFKLTKKEIHVLWGFKLAKNEINVFWGFLSLHKMKFMNVLKSEYSNSQNYCLLLRSFRIYVAPKVTNLSLMDEATCWKIRIWYFDSGSVLKKVGALEWRLASARIGAERFPTGWLRTLVGAIFKLAKKWNSCFLRLFKLAKNEINAFWGF